MPLCSETGNDRAIANLARDDALSHPEDEQTRSNIFLTLGTAELDKVLELFVPSEEKYTLL